MKFRFRQKVAEPCGHGVGVESRIGRQRKDGAHDGAPNRLGAASEVQGSDTAVGVFQRRKPRQSLKDLRAVVGAAHEPRALEPRDGRAHLGGRILVERRRVGGIGIRQNFAGGFDDGGVVRRTGFLPERFVFLFRQPMPGFPAFLGGKYAFGTAPHGAQHGRHVRERHFGAGGERKLLIDVARIVKERAVGVGQVAPGAARFLQVIFK